VSEKLKVGADFGSSGRKRTKMRDSWQENGKEGK
jgi:hypothetical protein